MITRIVIENFKSLRKVDLSLGRMNLFIGANASGKSNFLEALRVLEGIGRGCTINETLNGKPRGAANEVWEGIRGGSTHACFAGSDNTDEVAIEVHGRWDSILARTFPKWEYRIVFSPEGRGKVRDERINTMELVYKHGDFPESFYSDPSRPVLGMDKEANRQRLGELSDVDISYWLVNLAGELNEAQRVDLRPEVLRGYSQEQLAGRMGDQGENFAAVINMMVCHDEKAKDAYLTWLRQLRPDEIENVGTLYGALGEPMFMLQENGQDFPAPVLSDGTLRFAAIAAAFFQDIMPGIMTIEEIENGIHASRVQLLLELMRSQAENHRTQVVATTHSATVLDWLQEEDYKTTFLCRRDESTGESRICSLAQVPHFLEVVKKKPASELFSEGWLEMAP
jgi:predicted ATPase